MARRRFIAGAKCVKCGEIDKICLHNEGEVDWIECVNCGHTENRPDTVETKDPDHEEVTETGAVKWFGKG